MQLIINKELKNILPPLSEEEYAGLEADILENGCLSPLIVWGETIVDGFIRYAICQKHCIPFYVRQLDFSNLDEAKMWRWKSQEHRRNLTPFQRAEIALRLKEVIAAKAKERQRRNHEPLTGDPIETRRELANIAGTSTDTVDKVEYLVKHADPITKERLRKGEKWISINSEYRRLRNSDESKPYPPLSRPFGEDRLTRSVTPQCNEIFGLFGTDSKELANWFFQNRTVDFVRGLVRNLINDSRIRYRGETKQEHLRSLNGKPLE